MWDRAPADLKLRQGEVHVWRVHAGGRSAALDDALRRVLARYCGIAPAAIRFRRTPRGKPYLDPDSEIRFNLSHSGELALVAVARSLEVGVDVERHRQMPDALQIARRVLPPEEADALAALPPDQRTGPFYRYWTRFEARLKATGSGLVEKPAIEGWPVEDLDPGEGYAAAVAAECVPRRIRTFEYAD